MSYLSDGLTVTGDRVFHGGRALSVRTVHADKVVQCYVSGVLAAWARPHQGGVEFVLPESLPTDIVLLLAVDAADAEVNYWGQALSADQALANRIRVRTPQLSLAYMPGDVWKVCVDERLEHVQAFFPGGRRVGGYGLGYGDAYGFDAGGARGYGANFGRGEYGFDCDMLVWTSEALRPGEYSIEVVVASARGDDSPGQTAEVTLSGYAQPASGLTVDSYDPSGDGLKFSFTESEDIN